MPQVHGRASWSASTGVVRSSEEVGHRLAPAASEFRPTKGATSAGGKVVQRDGRAAVERSGPAAVRVCDLLTYKPSTVRTPAGASRWPARPSIRPGAGLRAGARASPLVANTGALASCAAGPCFGVRVGGPLTAFARVRMSRSSYSERPFCCERPLASIRAPLAYRFVSVSMLTRRARAAVIVPRAGWDLSTQGLSKGIEDGKHGRQEVGGSGGCCGVRTRRR